jgi:hypothetical protein
MKTWLIHQMLQSKKFWYTVAGIVIPLIVRYLGVDEETASNVFYALLTLVLGQGIADSAKK